MSCRRTRRHDASQQQRTDSSESSPPAASDGARGGHCGKVTAEHMQDAIRNLRTSEKVATVGMDIISNFAQHFAAMMDPFGVYMDAASTAAAGAASEAAGAASAAVEAAKAANGAACAATAAAMSAVDKVTGAGNADASLSVSAMAKAKEAQQPAAPQKQETPSPVVSQEQETPSPVVSQSPVAPRREDLVLIEDDIDDDDFVQVSNSNVSTGSGSDDSVIEALIRATKEKAAKRQNPEFD